MDRLTTDKPANVMNMTELALNNCHVCDGRAWYRDFDGDFDALEFIRNTAKVMGVEITIEDDETLNEILYDWLEDGFSTTQGILSWMYWMIWSKAEIYEMLKMYEERDGES